MPANKRRAGKFLAWLEERPITCDSCFLKKDAVDFTPARVHTLKAQCRQCHSDQNQGKMSRDHMEADPDSFRECPSCDRIYHVRYARCLQCNEEMEPNEERDYS